MRYRGEIIWNILQGLAMFLFSVVFDTHVLIRAGLALIGLAFLWISLAYYRLGKKYEQLQAE